MGRLTDILNGNAGDFNNAWNNTAAAADFGPIPKGVYVCHATRGELKKSPNKGTPYFDVEFTVVEGEFAGRKLWLPLWLTEAATPGTKRDAAKLGIISPPQFEQPLPRWYRCRVTAVVRRDDSGIEKNEVKGFDVVGIDRPEPDAFAPPTAGPPSREAGDEPPPIIPDGVPF